MKPLQNTIKVLLNSLAGKEVDMGSLADNRIIVYDAGTDQYTHVDFPSVTFEALLANGDVGTGATQVAYGNHLHAGVYEELINKSLSILTDQFSDVKYPTVKAVKTYADAVAARISTGCLTSPDLIDNGDGTATITSTTVNIYPAPDFMGTMQTFVVPQATLSFTDNTEEYVSVRYNLGSPIYVKETYGPDMNHSDVLPIFTVWRLGNVIHSLNFDSLGAGLANKAQSAMYHTSLYEISSDGGLVITESVTPVPRTVNVTGGIVYTGAIHQDVGAFTSATNQMTEAINTPTGWTYTDKSVYNNTQFNNGTSLANISNNKYAVRWWYRSIGDAKQLFYVLGTVGNYNNPTDAALEQPRTDLSPILKHHCMLIGRSIIQYNAASGVTQSLLDQHYAYSSVINHDDTGNISLVGSGVVYGHINDQTQTIYGIKTFNSSPLVPTAVANTNSTVTASTAYADAKVSSSITSGILTIAPSQDAVFNALALKLNLATIANIKGISGFVDGDNIAVTYSYTNRTITLTGDLRYMWRGVEKNLVSPWTSSVHNATIGNWYLSTSDGTNFVWSNTVWDFSDVMVASVKYKASAAQSFAIRDTHGTMDHKSHEEFHSRIGTYLVAGGKPTAGTYVENTATDAATSPGFDAATIKDEDSISLIPTWVEGTYTTMYIGNGNVAVFNTASATPFTATSNTYIQVNDIVAGTMTVGVTSKFYNVYQVLVPVTNDTNSQVYRMVMLQPQATFTSLASAITEDTNGLSFGDLAQSSPEFVIYSRITYTTLASDSNIGKCRIATGGITYVTGSKASQISISGIGVNNHSALSNLTWLLSGHIGGVSTLIGFDAAGLAAEYAISTFIRTAGDQTISSGIKTFSVSPLVPTATANTNSTIAASTAYVDAKVADSITDGVTTIAPSQNVVFDSLALKAELSHTHGNITNTGAIGTTAGLMVITGTSGVLTTLTIGAAGQMLTSTGSPAQPTWSNNATINVRTVDNTLGSNLSYSGLVESGTVGENVVFGDVLYLKFSDGKWWKALATAYTTTPAARMAMASISANASGALLIEGSVRYDSWSLAANKVYLSAATSGAITTTQPSATGNQIQVLGVAKTSTTMYFKPSLDVGEK